MAESDNYARLPLEDLEALIELYEATTDSDEHPLHNERLNALKQVHYLKVTASKWKRYSRIHEQRAKEHFEDALELAKLTDELDKVNNNRGRFIRHLRGYMIPAEQMALTELSTFINHRGQVDVQSLYDYLNDYAIPLK